MAKLFVIGKTMRLILTFFALLLSITLTQCTSYDFSRRIVQQGNLISAKKVAQLKPGMSKEDVAILMGTSLLSPMFQNDRWDYAYTWRKGSGTMEQRHTVLYFSHDRLTRTEHTP